MTSAPEIFIRSAGACRHSAEIVALSRAEPPSRLGVGLSRYSPLNVDAGTLFRRAASIRDFESFKLLVDWVPGDATPHFIRAVCAGLESERHFQFLVDSGRIPTGTMECNMGTEDDYYETHTIEEMLTMLNFRGPAKSMRLERVRRASMTPSQLQQDSADKRRQRAVRLARAGLYTAVEELKLVNDRRDLWIDAAVSSALADDVSSRLDRLPGTCSTM